MPSTIVCAFWFQITFCCVLELGFKNRKLGCMNKYAKRWKWWNSLGDYNDQSEWNSIGGEFMGLAFGKMRPSIWNFGEIRSEVNKKGEFVLG